jgi:hypothetical protein
LRPHPPRPPRWSANPRQETLLTHIITRAVKQPLGRSPSPDDAGSPPWPGPKGTFRYYVAGLKLLYRTTSGRKIIGDKTITKGNAKQETWQEQLLRICGIDVTTCPVCQKGRMSRMALLLSYQCNSPPEFFR